MRNMSFSMTERQLLDGTKTVTRRLGWTFLKPGDRLRAVRKSRGLKKGESVHVLGVIEVVSVRRERLGVMMTEPAACSLEGFHDLSPLEFIRMFCRAMKCQPSTIVTRIEFRRVEL